MTIENPELIALAGTIITGLITGMGILIKWMMNTITENQKVMVETINNNTSALSSMSEVIRGCTRKGK
jgi:hypothetical protein